mgnify:CR=1 FL=1
MATSAIEAINNIIDVSNTLLELLDTSNRHNDSESQANDTNLLTLMTEREQKIHALFESFTIDELQTHNEALQHVATLDKQLVDTINVAQKLSKSKILSLKKGRKAINIYQKS